MRGGVHVGVSDFQWGYPSTVDGQRTERLADVVRRAMQPGQASPDGLPLKRAAAWVIDALQAARPAWWLRDSVDAPQPLTDAVVWRERCRSGVEYLEWQAAQDAGFAAAGVFFLSPYTGSMDESEAMRRGLPVEDGHGPYFTREEWQRIEELPALCGAAGVLTWLRLVWVDRVTSVADLDAGEAARLAILETDAARLPWLGTASQVRQLDNRVVQPSGVAWPHAPGPWTEAEKEALRIMRAAGMKEEEIAQKAGCKRQVVAQQIGPRKKKAGVAVFDAMRRRA